MRRLLTCALAAAALTACFTSPPLTRSYDDPYNSPAPDAVAPPSLNPAEEECIRSNNCRAVCRSGDCSGGTARDGQTKCSRNSQCSQAEICLKSRCVPAQMDFGPQTPAPPSEP